ncbi:unnamed protein product [marine sediment metagenome]|uniref:Uncharacterized protein n=1 Tax=marine sediment metagenome TaxID=412755 RepID=X1PLF8_9ZZZZ
MSGRMALEVNCHWQAGYVSRKDINMNGKSRSCAATSHWSDAQIVDPLQDFPF